MKPLVLKTEIYDRVTVAQAALDFKQVATIGVSHEPESIICTFSNCVYGEETTMNEFENYLIDLTNSLAK